MDIARHLRIDGKTFKYLDRKYNAILYLREADRKILKVCVKGSEEFFKNFDNIMGALKTIPQFVTCYGTIKITFNRKPYNLNKNYMMEWIVNSPCLFEIPPHKRFPFLQYLAVTLHQLYDKGYYWSGCKPENIILDRDDINNWGKIKLCDLDSIKHTNPNQNFEQHYPWYWTIREHATTGYEYLEQ